MLVPWIFTSLITGMTAYLPVQVASCEISTPAFVPQSGDQAGWDQIGNYVLHVRFLNRNAEAVSRVVFQLDNGTTITDAGSFSQNVLIDHRLPLDKTDATGCSLYSVQLADGNTFYAASSK